MMRLPLLVLLLLAELIGGTFVHGAELVSLDDQPFWQDSAIHYRNEVKLDEYELRTIRADRDGNVCVNTSKGLLKAIDGRLVLDRSYRGLEGANVYDLEVFGGKFVLLTDKFFLPLTGGGKEFVPTPPQSGYRRFVMTGPTSFTLFEPLGSDRAGSMFVVPKYEGNKRQMVNNISPEKLIAEIEFDPGTGRTIAWSSKALFDYLGNGKLNELPSPSATITDAAVMSADTLLVGTTTGLFEVNQTAATPYPRKIPVPSITCVAKDPNRGWIWAGTTDGLFRQTADGKTDYYEGRRWLPDNHVLDFTFDKAGDVFVLTKGGVSQIHFEKTTLENKADKILSNLRHHHIRFGLVSDLVVPNGDYAQAQMHDSDNDGLWSSMYLASEAYRLAVTGAEDASLNLQDGFDAIERLVTITGIPGFQARSFELHGFHVHDKDAWRTRTEKDFEWKGTTSSDELVGTIFFYSVVYDVLGKENEKLRTRIADLVGSIVSHIVDHNLFYVDVDGKPTRWGYWNPANINTPIALHDRRLNSIEILAFLQLAYDLTKDDKFKKTYDDLVDKHGYANNTVRYLPDPMGPWNHSDDELYWLSYYVLLSYPIREDLSARFRESADAQYVANARKRNPLWTTIYSGRTGKPADLDGIAFWLRQFPMDSRDWKARNSHREDVTIEKRPFVPPEASPVLPPDERHVHKWNSNEMTLDGGGSGGSAESGSEYLLPYWMARYFRIIQPPTKTEAGR
jgi:hypothetical protein